MNSSKTICQKGKNNPTISVIVPVYNAEKYLHRCIDSILSQTFTDFELLLIDDGSKDSSGDICDEYAKKDTRVKVFHKGNGGVSSARNIGLANTNGEAICFADSDDFFFPDAFENYLKSDADLVLQGYVTTDVKDGRKITKVLGGRKCSTPETIHNALLDMFNYGMFFGILWNKMLRADIIHKHCLQFDENISWREDELFLLQYFSHIKSVEIMETLAYNYTVNDNSLLHRDWRPPQAMIYVTLKCIKVSSELTPDYYFRYKLQEYFMSTLASAGWMIYSPHHLPSIKERYRMLSTIHHFEKSTHSKNLSRFCYKTPLITDIVHLLWMAYKYKRL